MNKHNQTKALFQKALSSHQAGNVDQAKVLYEEIIQMDPDHSDACHLLGVIQAQQGKEKEAIKNIQRAIQLSECDIYLNSLGAVFLKQGHIQKACSCLNKALAQNDLYIDAYNNLGQALLLGGECMDALNCFKKMLSLQNNIPQLQSNYLMCLNYVPSLDDSEIYKSHLNFNKLFDTRQSYHKKDSLRPLKKTLRIGYVSPDFSRSSVAFFVEPVLQNHNFDLFEIYCYANVNQPDDVTQRFQSFNIQWVDTMLMTDDQMASTIVQDKIDILVDLCGHFSGNRLGVFARQPAPIQVTWLGYPNTTGLSSIQYRLTDAIADPNKDAYYSEKLIRLPSPFLCYRPIENSPDISPLPALNNGFVTLGSLNNLAKINASTIQTWAKILNQLPHARLLFKGRPFIDTDTQNRFQQKFEKFGITPDRLIFRPYEKKITSHLMTYHDIDLALDSFPYHGTTTTCDALWMGVPVIILCGNKHASRVGATLLSAVGLTDFITHSIEEYIEKTIQIGQDFQLLKTVRGHLRSVMANSPLMDAKALTQNVEFAYQQMWSGKY